MRKDVPSFYNRDGDMEEGELPVNKSNENIKVSFNKSFAYL